MLLALEHLGLDGLHDHRIPDEPICGGAHQHLPDTGRLFQPGCHVDRVAGHQVLAGRRVAGHDLTGIHTDTRAQEESALRFQLGAEASQ